MLLMSFMAQILWTGNSYISSSQDSINYSRLGDLPHGSAGKESAHNAGDAALHGHIPCGFPAPLSDPHMGKPDVGFRTFTTVGELLWFYCSPVCGSPTQQVWNLILLWFHPSYHLIVASSLSLDMGYLFLASFCWWLFSSYQKHQKLQLLLFVLSQCLLPHGR